MEEKRRGKFIIIIVIVILIIAIGLGVFFYFNNKKNNEWREAKSVEEIVINDKDSKKVKIEKIQKKIELLNAQIDQIQLRLNPELEKLNSFYEDYVQEVKTTNPQEEIIDESSEEEVEAGAKEEAEESIKETTNE